MTGASTDSPSAVSSTMSNRLWDSPDHGCI